MSKKLTRKERSALYRSTNKNTAPKNPMIGDRLKAARLKCGLTVKQLSSMTNSSCNWIWLTENNERIPSTEWFRTIEEALRTIDPTIHIL